MRKNIEIIRGFILDANVIIDLRNSDYLDLTISLSQNVEVYVVEQTREKVAGLSKTFCKALGLSILDPTLEEILDAALFQDEVPQLAEDDALTLAVGFKRNLNIVSNDTRVRKFSAAKSHPHHGGFFLLLFLFDRNFLTKNECIKVANDILETNKWMSKKVFEDLKRLLNEREK